MPEREVTIRVDVSGQETIAGLQQQIANLYAQAAKAVVVNIDSKGIDQAKGAMASAAASATSGFKGAAGAAKEVGTEVENVAKSSLSTLNGAVQDVYKSATKVAGAFAGMAAGGAIAGFSYIGAAKTKIYTEEVYAAIAANKRWGLSVDEVKARVATFQGVGWTSSTQMLKNIQAAYTYGGRFARGTEEVVTGQDAAGKDIKETMGRGEIAAQAAAKIAFNYVGPDGESIDPQDLLQTIYKQGPMREGQKQQLAIQLGVDINTPQLNSVAGRIKLLESHFGDGLKDMPWKIAQQNVNDLQKSIGEGVAPTMALVTSALAALIGMITKIPGGGALIGYIAIGIGLASALSLVVSLGTPLVTLFTVLKGLMLGHAVANAAVASTSVAVAGAEGVEAAANMGVAASAYAMAAGMWAAIAPIILIAVPLVALAAILYLVESKTHLFSNTLKSIGQTQMAADLLNWFKGLGNWIGQGIKGLDSFYKMVGGGGGVLKMAMDVSTSGAMLLLKPTLMLVDFLYKLWVNSGGLNKLITTGLSFWKMISDFIGGLLATLKSLWSWLMNAIPGARKEEARQKLEGAEKGTGLSYAGMDIGPGGSKEPFFTFNGQNLPLSTLTSKGIAYYDTHGTPITGPGISAAKQKELGGLAKTYESLPDMWGSIAKQIGDAVAAAVSTLPASIAGAIKGIFPDFSPLTKAIGDLQAAIAHWIPGGSSPNTGLGGISSAGVKSAYDPNNGQIQYFYTKGSSPEWEMKDWSQYSEQKNPSHRVPINVKDVPPDVVSGLTAHASGGLILSRGLLIGDPGEPIIPANVASSSRLQEILTIIATGPGPVPARTSAQSSPAQQITINMPITIGKVEKEVDLDKLVFRLRGKLEELQTRNIGYLQG